MYKSFNNIMWFGGLANPDLIRDDSVSSKKYVDVAW